jgi:hypothetical protein
MKNDGEILATLDALKASVVVLEAKAADEEAMAALGALKANVAALEGLLRPPPPRRQIRDERPLTTYPIQPLVDTAPSREEAQRLRAIVLDRFPQLQPPDGVNEERSLDAFCAALSYVGSKRRAEKPNSKYALSWFLQECRQWLQGRSISVDVTGKDFIAAVVAAGDVKFVVGDRLLGTVWEFGLEAHGVRKGEGLDAWRNVLNGQLLRPVAPRFRVPSSQSSITI